MPSLTNLSLAASFVAGLAALLAPCCISVLLPSYLANIFKEKRRVFLMTFVFFLGIATVFLPLGLGAGFLSQIFRTYHNQIFLAGGLFLIGLGLSLLSHQTFHLPWSRPVPFASQPASIYLLGVFSGVATTCCAPVLAGVLAIAAVGGTVVGGLVYTLAYVLGMVLPLFLIALFLDRINLTQKLLSLRRFELRFANRHWEITVPELLAGLVFVLMGGYIIYLAFNNRLYQHAEYQMETNLFLTQAAEKINQWTGFLPQITWSALVILLLAGLIVLFLKQSQKP